jgi:hypothetical protein
VENQEIMLPMDPRVFTASSLEAVAAGKFDRRHARNINGLISGCARMLELGGGIGFVALRAKAANENLSIAVQDDRAALIQFGQALADKHFPKESATIHFTATQLRPYDDADFTGLDAVLQDFKPDALRLSGRLLPPSALTEQRLTGLRRILLPFLDPSEIDQDRRDIAPLLAQFGFTEDPSAESSGTLVLRRD